MKSFWQVVRQVRTSNAFGTIHTYFSSFVLHLLMIRQTWLPFMTKPLVNCFQESNEDVNYSMRFQEKPSVFGWHLMRCCTIREMSHWGGISLVPFLVKAYFVLSFSFDGCGDMFLVKPWSWQLFVCIFKWKSNSKCNILTKIIKVSTFDLS